MRIRFWSPTTPHNTKNLGSKGSDLYTRAPPPSTHLMKHHLKLLYIPKLPPTFSNPSKPPQFQNYQILSLHSAMAKGGKLTKIKSVLKKMQSFKLGRASSIAAANASDDDSAAANLHPVFVGKSRRRYLITSDVMENPLFRELVDRRSGDAESVTVGCEVVLFEHLLWMLENADPQPESLDELVDFYAC